MGQNFFELIDSNISYYSAVIFLIIMCFFITQENVQNEKTLINFIKIHAPWSVVCEWAEHLSMRAPLQVSYHRYNLDA